MKNLLLIALIVVLLLLGCNTENEPNATNGNGILDDEFTVIFDLDGGNINGNSNSIPIKVKSGEIILILPNPQKGTDTFDGWFTQKNGAGIEFTSLTVVNSNFTVYAKWTSEQAFIVSFNTNGGSNVLAISGIKPGSTVTLPTNPTKINRIFEGWFLDNVTFKNSFSNSTSISSDITVYAKWVIRITSSEIYFDRETKFTGSFSTVNIYITSFDPSIQPIQIGLGLITNGYLVLNIPEVIPDTYLYKLPNDFSPSTTELRISVIQFEPKLHHFLFDANSQNLTNGNYTNLIYANMAGSCSYGPTATIDIGWQVIYSDEMPINNNTVLQKIDLDQISILETQGWIWRLIP